MAVRAGAVATPLALVTAVAVKLPLKLALAPLAGALNVTVTPLSGLLALSLTVACSAVPNVMFTAVLCGVPPVALMLPGPGEFEVRRAAMAVDH